ncbi:hypothetical protein ACFXPN_15215 [Streptomyces griseorubiginosus]|uniref:DUF7683 domain-containing protein n=1 Tax=Streptomyces griseorubiginosus TaxID=67304 RepID=UPI0036A68CA9
MSINFSISRYPKDSDSFDSSVDVTAVGADAWGELLGMAPEQLADVYPLTDVHAERVLRLTGIALDLETYEYFLEPSSG